MLALLAGQLQAMAAMPEPDATLKDKSMPALKQRLADIDSELEQLALYSLNGGVGAVGHQTKHLKPGSKMASIHIDLGETHSIDQVVLVPTLWRDTDNLPRADGFPLEFCVRAGTANTTNELASFTESDGLLPRIAPVILSFQPVEASWIIVDVQRTSLAEGNTHRLLKLAEILVFSGSKNVALHKTVTATSPAVSPSLHQRFLVDGFVPYLMVAALGEKSQAIALKVDENVQHPSFMIDLGASYPVNEINLHAIDQSRTIPATLLNDYAIPRRLRITGANRADFSDKTLLYDYEQKTVGDIGTIIMLPFQETECRYIRFTALEPESLFNIRGIRPRIGFDEIVILSGGQNVALNRPVTANSGLRGSRNALERLTDGRNFFGTILPMREWMNQLSRRHDLETERPIVEAELNARYTRQKNNLTRMYWLAALLAAGIAFAILAERIIHLRQLTRIRERIAADLHDELGANFHAIGLLSQLIEKNAAPVSDTVSPFLKRIREIIARSSIAVRHISRMQEASELYSGMEADMQRAAERIVAELKHDFSFEGEQWLARLRPQPRIDLLLFYKECLVNICRHSGATELNTRLTAGPKEIRLTVADNGFGITGATDIAVPKSLKRRARMLKATLTAESPPEGGTRITLTFRPRRKFVSPRIKQGSP